MTTPLHEIMVARHGFTLVDDTSLDAFLKEHEHALLFFPGDAERLVESKDVAVILPEIMKLYRGRMAPAVVAPDAQRALQRRFRFNVFPSIVFMRRDGYLGVLSRVLDWSQYLADIPEILAREVTEPPPFEFPPGCYSAGMASTRTQEQREIFE